MSSDSNTSAETKVSVEQGSAETNEVQATSSVEKQQTKEEKQTSKVEEIPIYNLTIKTLRGDSIPLQVSPIDSVQEIRQYLFDLPDTCDLTSYALAIESTSGLIKINEFLDIHEIKEITNNISLVMVPEPYNERSILLHIRRLREILSAYLFDFTNSPSPSLFSSLVNETAPIPGEHGPIIQEQQTSEENETPEETKSEEPLPLTNGEPKQKGRKKGKKGSQPENKNKNKQTKNKKKSLPHESALIEEQEKKEIDSDSLVFFYPSLPTRSMDGSGYVKEIRFSAWNPPPRNRLLLGDLCYLEIVTIENSKFHVTCWSDGFYINNSTDKTFDPNPRSKRPCRAHSLVDLLSLSSPTFKKLFFGNPNFDGSIPALPGTAGMIEGGLAEKHPFELVPVNNPIVPWVGVLPDTHVPDQNRADYSILEAELDPGNSREWNEEYQRCRELPRSTIGERMLRDKTMQKVNNEFVAIATRGAVAIVNGTIPALNPHQEEALHMYVYNNIFFSYANPLSLEELKKLNSKPLKIKGEKSESESESKEISAQTSTLSALTGLTPEELEELENEDSYRLASNDLKGLQLWNEAEVDGISTLLTALIDYKGYRLTAQSIIPGVLATETTNIVYGSINRGKEIHDDEKFHSLIKENVEKGGLTLVEHQVSDSSDGKHNIYLPVESKGIVGTDGRKYIVDLVRLMPKDLNWENHGRTFANAVFRRELVDGFVKIHYLEKAKEGMEKEAIEKLEKEILEEIKYNVNVGTEWEEKEEDNKSRDKILGLGKFLVEKVVPKLVDDFAMLMQSPVDGQVLSSILHRRGINLRYLGLIANTSRERKRERLSILCEQEMLVRATRVEIARILREENRSMRHGHVNYLVADVLNLVFGNVEISTQNSENVNSKKKKKQKSGFPLNFSGKLNRNLNEFSDVVYGNCSAVEGLTSSGLWKSILELIKLKYNYEFPELAATGSPFEATHEFRQKFRNVQVFRGLCLKSGIQVTARDYNFDEVKPFKFEDILDVFPIIKHLNPKTQDGQNLLEQGKAYLQQGRLDIAFEFLTEALNLFHQIYGPMHLDTALCYGNLAMLHFNAGDLLQAVIHQKRAVITNERVLGLDHPDTAYSYSNLSMFYQGIGRLREALECIKRCYYLSKVVMLKGVVLPDTGNSLTQLGVLYQELGYPKIALGLFKDALTVVQECFGDENLQSGSACHAIAVASSMVENYKDAMNYERRNNRILEKIFGKNDYRTVESDIWLKQFTAKAVQAEIEVQKLASLGSQYLGRMGDMKHVPRTLPRSVGHLGGGIARGQFKVQGPGRGGMHGRYQQQQQQNMNEQRQQAPREHGEKPIHEVLAFINGTTTDKTKGKGKRK